MNELLQKLIEVAERIVQQKGSLRLLALVMIENPDDEAWDLVASAPWLDRDRLEGLRFIAQELNNSLTSEEMFAISRIVPLETSNQTVVWLSAFASSQSKPFGIASLELAGARIHEGYIVAADTGETVPPQGIPTRLQ